MQSNKIKQAVSIVVAAFAIAGTAHTASATSGSWVSPTSGGNWSTNANWTGATFPTTGETATLGDVTSGTRTSVYDAGASGLLGTLTLTQTTAGQNNILDIQRALTISTATTIGASAGTAQVRVGTTGSVNLTNNNSWTVNTGGSIFITRSALLGGSTTLSGGTITVDGNASAGSVTNFFLNDFSMSLGTLTLANGSDVRAQFDGNFTGTGGDITRTATNAQFVMNGATNSFSGLTTFDTSIIASLNRNGDQSFSSTVALGNILVRGASDPLPTSSILNKTVTSTHATRQIGQLQFINSTNGGTTNFVLGSNLTTTGTGSNPFAQNFGSQGGSSSGTVNFGINTNGNTLDLTSNATTFTPNTATNTSAIQTNWSFTGAGTIRATNFNLSTLLTQVNVGSGTTLQVMG